MGSTTSLASGMGTLTPLDQGDDTSAVATDHLRPFDFRNPGKMARDDVRSLELAHEVFGRRLGSALTNALQAVVRLELLSMDQVTYDEYVRSMPTPTVLAVVGLPPLPGTAIIETSTQMGLTLVDRMLGGIGRPTAMRYPTELETVLLQRAVGYAVEALAATLEPLAEVTPDLLSVEFNPHFVQTIDPAEMVLVLSYSISITQGIPSDGLLTLCYPFTLLEPAMQHLAADGSSDRQAELEAAVARQPEPFAMVLPEVSVPISVRLRGSRVQLTDLASLQPGDVLRLDHAASDAVLGYVADKPLLEARLGQRGRKMAIELIGWRMP